MESKGQWPAKPPAEWPRVCPETGPSSSSPVSPTLAKLEISAGAVLPGSLKSSKVIHMCPSGEN